MIAVTPMRYGDIALVDVQAEQVSVSEISGPAYDQWLLTSGPAFTVRAEGKVIACMGVVEQWDGRSMAWAVLGQSVGKHFLPLTRAISAYFSSAPFRRVEAYVDANFKHGCRWAHLLGFTLETPRPMSSFFPNGNDAYLYARTRTA